MNIRPVLAAVSAFLSEVPQNGHAWTYHIRGSVTRCPHLWLWAVAAFRGAPQFTTNLTDYQGSTP